MLKLLRGEPFQTRDHQPVFSMSGAELSKRVDGSFQIFVRVQGGYDQNERPRRRSVHAALPALHADLKEDRIDAMRNGGDFTFRPRKERGKIPRGVL